MDTISSTDRLLPKSQVQKVTGIPIHRAEIYGFFNGLKNYAYDGAKHTLYKEADIKARVPSFLTEYEAALSKIKQRKLDHINNVREIARSQGRLGKRKSATTNNADLKERLQLLRDIAALEKQVGNTH